MDLKINYHKVLELNLVGYLDSDWDGSCDDRKRNTRFVFN